MPRTMSATQAAEHFSVNIKTIRRWISNSKLSAEMIDGRWHVHVEGENVPYHTQNGTPTAVHSLKAQLERADSEICHLRDQLTEKDNQLTRRDEQIESQAHQLDHLTQLLAVQTKTNAVLTDRLHAIEDMRKRPLWKRIFIR